MGRILVFVTLFYVAILAPKIYCDETFSLSEDEAEPSLQEDEIPQIPSDTTPKKQNLVTIDLSECTCTSMSSCDLTILKSPLMDITCADEESLCCPMTKSEKASSVNDQTVNDDSPSAETESDIAPRSNIRVYSIIPTVINVNTTAEKERNALKNKNRKCSCKARSSCPHKYIDYGFGFHCTYSTVRCCIPDLDEITITVDMAVNTTDSEKVQEPSAPLPTPTLNGTETELTDFETLATVENENSVDSVQVDDIMLTVNDMNSTVGAENNDMGMVTLAETENTTFVENMPEINNEGGVMMTSFTEDDAISSGVEVGVGEADEQRLKEEEAAAAAAAAEGELIITEVTNWTGLEDGEEDYQKEAECFCLPISKCRVGGSYYDTSNMIERRRDTLCPGDLVQCCGRDVLEEITKKADEVAGDYVVGTPIKSEIAGDELPPQEYAQYPVSSDTYPMTNTTDMGTMPAGAVPQQEVSNLPSPSILPAPFPGYQPPGYYKGYGNQQQQYPVSSYPNSQQAPTNQYYPSGQQQQLQPSLYDTNNNGGQAYSPYPYSKYTPQQYNMPPQNGAYPPRHTYNENDASKHKSGGLFETLSKYLG